MEELEKLIDNKNIKIYGVYDKKSNLSCRIVYNDLITNNIYLKLDDNLTIHDIYQIVILLYKNIKNTIDFIKLRLNIELENYNFDSIVNYLELKNMHIEFDMFTFCIKSSITKFSDTKIDMFNYDEDTLYTNFNEYLKTNFSDIYNPIGKNTKSAK